MIRFTVSIWNFDLSSLLPLFVSFPFDITDTSVRMECLTLTRLDMITSRTETISKLLRRRLKSAELRVKYVSGVSSKYIYIYILRDDRGIKYNPPFFRLGVSSLRTRISS
jgi:hypothetical protein